MQDFTFFSSSKKNKLKENWNSHLIFKKYIYKARTKRNRLLTISIFYSPTKKLNIWNQSWKILFFSMNGELLDNFCEYKEDEEKETILIVWLN